MTRQLLVQNLKMLWATYHFAFKSKDPKAIASVIDVNIHKLHQWMQTDAWLEALDFWGQNPKASDLNFAEKLWTEMIENNEHLSFVDSPDEPIRFKQSEDVLKASAVIHSHLFCVDGLCAEQIRTRLAEEREFEGEPIRYEGQALGNSYRWWLYPNWYDSIYSKVLARVNAAADLVVGTGEDTSLVMIRHGRLTLTRQVCDDIVSAFDERLLVCL